MSLNASIAVGTDISKSHLDIYHGGTEACRQFANTPSGIAKPVEWLKALPSFRIVVLEAKVLALYGTMVAIQPTKPEDADLQSIEGWLVRLSQRVGMRVDEPNRRRLAAKTTQERIGLHIGQLQRGVEWVGQELVTRVQQTAPGKPKKVALVAAMRKLPTIINAVFRTGGTLPDDHKLKHSCC